MNVQSWNGIVVNLSQNQIALSLLNKVNSECKMCVIRGVIKR